MQLYAWCTGRRHFRVARVEKSSSNIFALERADGQIVSAPRLLSVGRNRKAQSSVRPSLLRAVDRWGESASDRAAKSILKISIGGTVKVT